MHLYAGGSDHIKPNYAYYHIDFSCIYGEMEHANQDYQYMRHIARDQTSRSSFPPPQTLRFPFFGAFESGISDHIIACEYLTISFHHFSSFSSNFGHGDKVSGPFSFSIIIIVHLKSIEHKRSVTLKYGGSSKMLFQA